MQVLILLTLVFSVLVAVFALQNAYPVTVHFLNWRFEASLALVILFSVLSGALLFGIFGLVHQARTKIGSWQIGRKQKERKEESDWKEAALTPEQPGESGFLEEPNRVESGEEDGGESGAKERVEDKK